MLLCRAACWWMVYTVSGPATGQSSYGITLILSTSANTTDVGSSVPTERRERMNEWMNEWINRKQYFDHTPTWRKKARHYYPGQDFGHSFTFRMQASANKSLPVIFLKLSMKDEVYSQYIIDSSKRQWTLQWMRLPQYLATVSDYGWNEYDLGSTLAAV